MDELTALIDSIEADGYDADLVLPLYALLAESVHFAISSRRDGDDILATVGFGRVSGIMDVMATLGVPTPGDSPADVLDAAEALYESLEEGDSDN